MNEEFNMLNYIKYFAALCWLKHVETWSDNRIGKGQLFHQQREAFYMSRERLYINWR